MASSPVTRALHATALALLCSGLPSCSSTGDSASTGVNAIVSVRDQKMGVYKDGTLVKRYDISTSKFGVGDRPGSCCTPLGKHEVVAKIGSGLPAGAVLKSRHWNGEVLRPNAPGRDPIVSRILWLNGLERGNKNAYGRFIYIHGTTEENRLGSAASYGCVRMSARDVIDLYNQLSVGAKVTIMTERLPRGTVGDPDQTVPASAPVQLPAPTPNSIVPASAIAYTAPSASAASAGTAVSEVPQPFDPSPAKPEPTANGAPAAATAARPQRLPGPGVILKTRCYSPGASLRGDG
jgi:hypothetical protein